MIRWKEIELLSYYRSEGYVGKYKVFYIDRIELAPIAEHRLYSLLPNFDKNGFCTGKFKAIDDAKQVAEDILKDWLDRANLMSKSNCKCQELKNMLEDVVNELDLSGCAVDKHGQLGTPPSELVKLVLKEKDIIIAGLKAGFQFVQAKEKKDELDK